MHTIKLIASASMRINVDKAFFLLYLLVLTIGKYIGLFKIHQFDEAWMIYLSDFQALSIM